MQVKSCSCSINNNIKKISEKRATITITTANSSKREKNKFLARNSYGRWIFWICHQYCCCCCCCCLLFYRCHTFLFHLLLNLCFIYWKRTPLFPCTHTPTHTMAYAIPIRSSLSFSWFACCVHTMIKSYYIDSFFLFSIALLLRAVLLFIIDDLLKFTSI